LSVFVGIRPLVSSGHAGSTAAMSRDHTIHIDHSGLLSIAGGKWTTYRRMAEHCIDQAATLAELPEKQSVTSHLNIHGYHKHASKFEHLASYGSDGIAIQDMIRNEPSLVTVLHPELTYCEAEVVWAAKAEMATTIEDVLARRTRALFLNARAASAMAPRVAALMARELNRDEAWQSEQVRAFQKLACKHIIS
jgi:glycerol-3-phosphate dehydrogenase